MNNEQTDAWGKSICFNQIVFSIENNVAAETPTARHYAAVAREVMENAIADLGSIVNETYRDRKPSNGNFSESIGIMKALGYHPGGSIEKDKQSARKIIGELETSILDVTRMINNPSDFYADSKRSERLLNAATKIMRFYGRESGTTIRRYTSAA